ncbi:protein tyrosine phosphatase family protein [Nostoc sp. FACHB-87]|uniref:protein tyrosine phosphatase family protein n=1 Tax=Nostocales TaxID=1161 RepID=UPI001687495D|nr:MULTISPECIES: protein tyrosine phosphatase family protein [Nostocales]MBD2302088.1 protein tyrosine phosphatase family protein [Nostoc sp. FACHB-190]MBD2457410.1 protein tyrosine phosphatase family protein [Nostoc sp. FACHB-87]MBD2476629.1 protein tyrosine phosphatase family protein [Anabaena sp. FACHB-83]MBD2486440.1 protein tyrosine phosphatase family protein [Aulosira sp. FACHB-615]
MSVKNHLAEIYNFLQISDTIATSGQPTAEQFAAIKAAGYQLIVNLALPTSSNALANEQEIVASQEMQYIHIPVVWENPTLEDATKFFGVMETNSDKKIFVHCAANMRVSAFIYLFRRIHQGVSDAVAEQDLHKIWVPNEVWQKFIQQVLNTYQ